MKNAQLLGLNEKIITNVVKEIQDKLPKWREMVAVSFLSDPLKQSYLNLLEARVRRLGLT